MLFNCSEADAIYRRKVKCLTKLLDSGNMMDTVFTDIRNRELASSGQNVI